MKILLTLPLLVLLGSALAEEQSSFSRSCTGNGTLLHCIECYNGTCLESRAKRGVNVQSTSSSSSKSCHNGVCTGSSHTCHNGDCTYKREAEEGSYSESCTINNGHKECKICRDGVCHTTNKRKTEVEDAPVSVIKTCDNNGCTQCVNGICKKPLAKNAKGKATYDETTSTSTCNTLNDQTTCTTCENGICHQKVVGKRENTKKRSQGGSSSSSCTSINGVRKCTFCDERGCHNTNKRGCTGNGSEKHCAPGKRETVTSSSTTCNRFGCVICRNGNCFLRTTREEHGDTKLESKREGVYIKNCYGARCHVCENGVCRHKTMASKREAQNQSSTTVCVGHTCYVCPGPRCPRSFGSKHEAQNHSSSLSCIGNKCHSCLNGICKDTQ